LDRGQTYNPPPVRTMPIAWSSSALPALVAARPAMSPTVYRKCWANETDSHHGPLADFSQFSFSRHSTSL
jgi:hypothetical protein